MIQYEYTVYRIYEKVNNKKFKKIKIQNKLLKTAQKMSELKSLIQKLSSPIGQIQARTLTNMYMKITHKLITQQQLMQYQELPGYFMSWINQNKKKSQLLIKVLIMLSQYTKFQHGLALLQKYQCLQFCQEFRAYLVQVERGVDIYLKELDAIIDRLTPYANSKTSQPISQPQPQNKSQTQPTSKSSSSHPPPPPATTFQHPTLNLLCQQQAVDQQTQKQIFELIMQLKYAHKDNMYRNLCQIRNFVILYSSSYFRCKPDLCDVLIELLISWGDKDGFGEICGEVLGVIMGGMLMGDNSSGKVSNRSTNNRTNNNRRINLTYSRTYPLPTTHYQLTLPSKLYKLPISFLIIEMLLKLYEQKIIINVSTSSNKVHSCFSYLLSIRYPYSSTYFIQLLKLADVGEFEQNLGMLGEAVQWYAGMFADCVPTLIQLLPSHITTNIPILTSYIKTQTLQSQLLNLQPYLTPSFHLHKNLHILPQLLQNLSQSVAQVSQNRSKGLTKLYLQTLILLTVSFSRRDMFMQHFQHILNIIAEVMKMGCKQFVIDFCTQLEKMLGEETDVVEYTGGYRVRKCEVVEVLWMVAQFVKPVLLALLEIEGAIVVGLRIFYHFLSKDKFKNFNQYVPIICALCYHPNEQVSSLAKKLYQNLPKQCTAITLCLTLFSSSPQTRSSILHSLYPTQPPCQPDIILKITQPASVHPPKSKLKLSQQSMDSYLNIIFNPQLQKQIKQKAISQFIDYVERVQSYSLPSIKQAQLLFVDEVKKICKMADIGVFQEKLVQLHLLFCVKVEVYGVGVGLEGMLGLLAKVGIQQTRMAIIKEIYAKVFQSPFTKQSNTANIVMNLYPHLQIAKMKIQPPFRPNISTETQIIKPSSSSPAPTLDQLYTALLPHIHTHTSPSQQTLQLLQQQIITATTTSKIGLLSKIAFLLAHVNAKNQIRINKATMKIIQQYVRTNSHAADFIFDLGRIVAMGDHVDGGWTGLYAIFGRGKDREIGGQDVEGWMKGVDGGIQKMRLFAVLVRQNGVKYGGLSQYSNLKLIQMIITQLRQPKSPNLFTLSLSLLHKLTQSQFTILPHISTLFALLQQILFQQKPTIKQFNIILSILAQLLHLCGPQLKYHNKIINDTLERVIAVVGGKSQSNSRDKKEGKDDGNDIGYQLVGGCFGFINQVLRIGAIDDEGREYYNTVANSPTNLLIWSSNFIPKITNPDSYTALCQIYTFFYYSCYYYSDNISILLSSTDIINITLPLIVHLANQSQSSQNYTLELLQAIGRALHLLALRTDQFIFRVNKSYRGDRQKGTDMSVEDIEYKLHYGIMSAVPVIVKGYKTRPKTLNDHSYIKMLIWVLYTWNQQTKILEQQQFLQPLLSHIIQTKQLQILGPLLTKSSTGQKMILSSNYMIEKLKLWVKATQQMIFELNKNQKKVGHMQQSKVFNLEQCKEKVREGLVFANCVFFNVSGSTVEVGNLNLYKEAIAWCVKFIDQLQTLLDIQPDQSLKRMLQKLLFHIFHNPSHSKHLSSLLSQGTFLTIQTLIQKLQKADNMCHKTQQLKLLGVLSYNESIRSLIIKNRIIQQVLNCLYLSSGEDIKGTKDYAGLYCAVQFLVFVSVFKDTNGKIQVCVGVFQNDKKILDVLAKVLLTQPSEVIMEKILDLLINLSAFKHSKSVFMSCRQIHKTCLSLLSDAEYPLKCKLLSLLYNILYKNAAGIKMYRKKQVIELLHQLALAEQLQETSNNVLEILQAE